MALKAQDVRHLLICSYCRKLLDTRTCVPIRTNRRYAHGRCYIAKHGLEAMVKRVPRPILAKLTLGDIGRHNMKRLLEMLDPASPAKLRKGAHARTQPREQESGRFAYDGDFDRLCRCGHRLGVHTAGGLDCLAGSGVTDDPSSAGELCDCRKFRPQIKRKARS